VALPFPLSLTLAAPSTASSSATVGPTTVAPTIGFGNLTIGGSATRGAIAPAPRVAPSPLIRSAAVSQLGASPVALALGALALVLVLRR